SYGITDEIFAVASAQKGLLTARYMYGLISVSTLGWCTGTFLGASAGQLLPTSLTNAMGIVLYAMFIAIVIPPAKKSRGVLAVAATAAICSMIFKYLLTQVSGGFAIIFSAIIAAVIGALVFPVADEEETEVTEQ
ncbi:MAG: AzlC family ABC transporter permease, partial [Clostridia bacterium]|nr:AzlC family ABC transporter permease [Clostridia bacterium]